MSGLYILEVKKKNHQNHKTRMCGSEAGPWAKVGHISKDIGEEVKVRNGLSVVSMGVSRCSQKESLSMSGLKLNQKQCVPEGGGVQDNQDFWAIGHQVSLSQ